jgi:hypothetical protein
MESSTLTALGSLVYSLLLLGVFAFHTFLLYAIFHSQLKLFVAPSNSGRGEKHQVEANWLFLSGFTAMFSFFYIREPDAELFTALLLPLFPLLLHFYMPTDLVGGHGKKFAIECVLLVLLALVANPSIRGLELVLWMLSWWLVVFLLVLSSIGGTNDAELADYESFYRVAFNAGHEGGEEWEVRLAGLTVFHMCTCLGVVFFQVIVGTWTSSVGYVLFEVAFFLLLYGVPEETNEQWISLAVIFACVFWIGVFEFALLCLLVSMLMLLTMNFANATFSPGCRTKFMYLADESQDVSGHRFLVAVDESMLRLTNSVVADMRRRVQAVNEGEGVDELECPYCCDRRRNRVMNCGHTGCDVCVEQFSTCPECRTVVVRVQPIFL